LHLDDGYPDGLCADAEGHLWIAIWSRGEVRRFNPLGELVGRVDVPAPHTSSVAFAGPDLDVLVITSATDELDDAQLAAYPHSGRLFIARVDTVGSPVPPWNPEA
jgi:sugar lactone lactonase YvrE